MKPYTHYKDSNIEWLGKVPEHWEIKKIKRLSSIKRGASPRPIADPKYFDCDGEFAWVRIADVSASNRYLENTTQTLSVLGSSLSVKIYPGQLFLSIAGTVGKAIITKIKCCIHDGFVFFPELNINPEFLFYIFSTGLPYQGLGKLGTQLNLNADTVGDIFIALPNKNNETNNIIRCLDKNISKIDILIEKKQRMIELLKEERTALINEAVTKGLDPNVKMKDSGIEWLGKAPKHWKVSKVKYTSNINPEALTEKTNTNFIIRYIDIGNVSLREIKNKPEEMTFKEAPSRARRIVKVGDTIVSTVRTYLKAISYIENIDDSNLICSTGFAVVRPNSTYNSKYFSYLLTSQIVVETICSMSTGVGYPIVNASNIANISIWLPPIDEQILIIDYLEKQLVNINKTLDKEQKQILLLQEYRTSMISEVVTGKIDVRKEKL